MKLESRHLMKRARRFGPAIVSALFFGALITILHIGSKEELPPLWKLAAEFAMYFVAVAVFLAVAVFSYRHYYQHLPIKFLSPIKSLRSSMIYGICLALFFTAVFLMGADDLRFFLTLFFRHDPAKTRINIFHRIKIIIR